MGSRSGSETRRMVKTTTVRWDDKTYAHVLELSALNRKSVGEMVRWLVNRSHRALPRTQELSRELIQLRLALNALMSAIHPQAADLQEAIQGIINEIEALLRDLRG